MNNPNPQRLEFATKFYELDRKLTVNERKDLSNVFTGIHRGIQFYSVLAFGFGFGAVYLKNRAAIWRSMKRVRVIRSKNPDLNNEEMLKKINELRDKSKTNNFGAKGVFAGIGCMIFGFPFTSKMSVNRAKGKLQAAVENSEGFDENNSRKKELEILELVQNRDPMFQWKIYYDMTSLHPEKAVKDPRVVTSQRGLGGRGEFSRARNERIASRSAASSSPSASSSPQYAGNSGLIEEETFISDSDTQATQASKYGEFIDTTKYGEGKSSEDVSSWGLSVVEENSQKQEENKAYGSSWDRVRSESNVDVNANSNMSSWDRVRRRSN